MGALFNREVQTSLRQQLRNRMTHAEKILWYYLRGKGVDGYKFRRQQGIGVYVVDFYCPAAKLAIELDGDSHYRGDAARQDNIRQRHIEALGIRVLRFTDNDVRDSIAGVIERIMQHLTPSNSPLKRGRKEKLIFSPYKGEVSPPASATRPTRFAIRSGRGHERAGRGPSARDL